MKVNQLMKIRKLGHLMGTQSSFVKESLLALLICVIGDLFAGIILGKMTFFLETFPGLLVLIPGAIGMRGNIFGSLASRLGTNLHIGILSPEFKRSKLLNENIIASIILTLILSLFLAFIAKGICILFKFNSMGIIDFTLISLFAGIISSLIMIPITMLISITSYNHGWDPDNVTTPLVAAFGDLFTLPAIILSIFLLDLISNSLLKNIIFVVMILIVLLSFIYGIRSVDTIKRITKQSTPILLVCSFLGIFAGGVLNSSVSTLLNNPSILTLVPLFSGESGNLVSILGARLSSNLHSGLIEPEFKPEKDTLLNFLIIFILAVIVYPFIGVIAESSSTLLGVEGVGFINIILISTISGIILIPIMMFIVFFISTLSFRKGLDPDNIVIPISTSITDSVSNSILMAISLLVLILI